MSGTVSRNGNIFEDVAIKAPVRLASTVSSLALTGLPTIDGVASTDGDRVLLTAQVDVTQNGIWQVSTGPWIRTADGRNNTDFVDGSLVTVSRGAVNAGKTFQLQCADTPVVIDGSQLVFLAQSDVQAGQQSATSATSLTIGTGPKTLAVQSGKAFAAGQYVLIYETSSPANAMLAQISSYAGTALVTNSVASGGSGTLADWTVVLANSPASAGRVPPIGTGNVTGPGTSTAGHIASFADGTGKVLVDSGIVIGALASRNTLLYGDAGAATIPASALSPGSAPLPFVGAQPADNLRLSNDVSNATRDIAVSTGRVRDDSDATNLHLVAGMFKRLDTGWAAGGASGAPAGACDSGTKGANQTWHIFLIAKRGMVVSQFSRTSNVATVTSAAHGLGAGGTCRVTAIGSGIDALAAVASVATNSISFANSGPDIATTSVSGFVDGYDILASQSYAAPTLPSGWTVKQCLGSFLTDGSGNLRAMSQTGDVFTLNTPLIGLSANNNNGARSAINLAVPLGVAVTALIRATTATGAGGSMATLFTSLQQTDQAPSLALANLAVAPSGASGVQLEIVTNTSGQIGWRTDSTNGTVTQYTYGWRDPRRRLF